MRLWEDGGSKEAGKEAGKDAGEETGGKVGCGLRHKLK